MRKLAILLTVILFCSAGIAEARTRHHHHAPPPPSGDPVLVGTTTVQSGVDSNDAGSAEAFAYTASVTGTATDAEVYVDSRNTATTLLVGVYSNASGKPGILLASGSLASPLRGSWNDVTLSNTSLTAGAKYWIALLGTGGTLYFRDAGSATSYSSSQTNLTALPSTYSSGTGWPSGQASAYVNGTSAPAPPPPPPPSPVPPSNTSAPTISGTPQQGDTLTASPGSWSGDTPQTYTYAWSDGATGQTDTLGASDVGQNVSVTVTATNDAGSATATSASVGPVTAPPPPPSGGCDFNVTPTTFSSAIDSAVNGQTVCLGAGNYGSTSSPWAGTSKAITIKPETGASPNLVFDFASTAANFTIDGGHTNLDSTTSGINVTQEGWFEAGSKNITLKNLSVTCNDFFCIDVDTAAGGIVIKDNVFHDMLYPNGTTAAIRVLGGSDPNGIIVEHNLFRDMGAQGVTMGSAGTVTQNEFSDVTGSNPNDPRHTDAVLIYGGTDDVITGNFIHNGCTQGIGGYDGNSGNTITDNVIVGCSVHSLVQGGDKNPSSLVAHNTVVGDPNASDIDCTSKSGEGPSTTAIRDNITQDGIELGGGDCLPSVNTNNMFFSGAASPDFNGTPIFVGGSSPSTYQGFALAAGSPGVGASTDGSDVGARVALYPGTPSIGG